jgi:hypothetical protein
MITLFPLYSQTNGRLWGGLEVGYGLSLADKGKMYDLSYGRDAKMTISTIKAVLGYYITPRLSLGAGIGLSSYTLPGVNTAPLCIDIRYHPVRDNLNIVLNGDIGYSLATSESDTKGKFMADFSLGYKLFNIKKINITPAIGYNYINYSVDNVFGKSNQSRHSIFMKIGILY